MKQKCKMNFAIRTNNIWNHYDFSICEIGEKPYLSGTVRHIKNCLKWSVQRIIRGYSDMDTANMYEYLQVLIPSMLHDLKAIKQGSASVPDFPEWDMLLDRMILLWKESREDASERKNPYTSRYFDNIHDMSAEFQKVSDQYHVEERILEQYRMVCKDEALDMLKKYFYYLCD